MFFAVTTLALSVPVATWLLNPTYFKSLTPSSIGRPHLLERYELDSPLRWYYLCLAALGAALVVVRRFRGSRLAGPSSPPATTSGPPPRSRSAPTASDSSPSRSPACSPASPAGSTS